MRSRTILLLLLLLILMVPLVGVVAFWSIDESTYRRFIARHVEAATGRKLALDGELRIVPALRPTLAVERVSLANPPWASRPEMVRLDRLELQLDLLSLLGGRPEIDRIVLVRPDILLETGPDGQANWTFDHARAPAGPRGEEGGERPPGGRSDLPVLREARIENGTLAYRDGASGRETVLRLDSARLAAPDPTAPVTLELAGALDGAPLSLAGEAGTLEALAGDGPIPIALAGRLAGVDGKLQGRIDDARTMAVDLAVQLKAADLNGLPPKLAGPALAPLAPLELAAKVAGDRRRLAAQDLSLRFGASDLAGSAALGLDGPRPRVQATLTSQRLDLRPFVPAGAAAESGAAKAKAPLFSRDPLPLTALRAADADLKLAVATLLTPKLALDEVKLDARLENGRLHVSPAQFALSGRPVAGSLDADAAAAPPRLALKLAADGLDIGDLLARLEVTSLLEGKGDLEADLAAAGASPHDLAATLGGRLSLLMTGGGLRTALLDRVTGGARQILGTLVTGRPADVTRLRCLALTAPTAQGVARPHLILDTELSTLVGTGTVDLGREAVDLTLVPHAKVANLNVALPVTVRGPLTGPGFGLDQADAARRIASLAGAALFPPAVVGAFADLGSAPNHPCLKLAADPGGLPGGAANLPARLLRDPGKAASTAKEALGQAKKAGKGLLQDLLRGR
jgi:uncharacterized protein involved in outer membrane biogenesis